MRKKVKGGNIGDGREEGILGFERMGIRDRVLMWCDVKLL